MTRYAVTTSVICLILGAGFLWGVDVGQLLNVQSLVIVFGGLCLAIWLGFPAERVRATAEELVRAFSKDDQDDEEKRLLGQALGLARIYRLNGPIALQKAASRIDSDFLRYGAILVAEGYSELSLLNALQREYAKKNEEASSQIQILRTLARLAPALGMAGTVVSLMQVMQHLGSQADIGTSLGLALSSTLYGILLSNLLFLPASTKLQQHLSRRASRMRLVMDALLGMQKAEHPLRIAERLNSYELYCKMKEEEKRAGATLVRLKKQAAA